MDNQLLKDLTELRDGIKDRVGANGRTPSVCTDAALFEMARLKPKTLDEMLYVSGLGKAFVEKYGAEFMSVLNDYNLQRKTTSDIMQPKVREVLKSLENRLVNINKRNRLLYMPKLSPKFAIDLFSEGGDEFTNVKLIDFIKKQEPNARFKILDTLNTEPEDFARRYADFKTLGREGERNKRESGEATLYIGYPFAIGRMSGENFSVRAPLALFPVELIINPTNVCLKMDNTKDVLFNNGLILTYYKCNNLNETLPSAAAEETTPQQFIEGVLKYFSDNGLEIKRKDAGVKKFAEYTASTFPKFKSGEFELSENVVLGKFSMYSGALQHDFKLLIENARINDLLNNLLQPVGELDIYSDAEDLSDTKIIVPPSERDLNYINELNISQENAVLNINKSDSLVIQGPPGTGKSQTITSLIADFVNKGKNVLMVSQKKAALDVIYSRLGKLSKYALLLSDVKDKDGFYEQLYTIFTSEDKTVSNLNEFNRVSDEIDSGLNRLDTIAEKMYYDLKFGAPMYQIYDENLYNRFQSKDTDEVKRFSRNVCAELLNEGYDEIKASRNYFDDERLLETFKSYYDTAGAYPWLSKTKSDYSIIDLSEILKETDAFVDEYVRYAEKGLIGKFFGKGRFKRALVKLFKKRFASYDKKLLKRFLKKPLELHNGFQSYLDYYSGKYKFESLSSAQKLYFGTLYNLYKDSFFSLSELNSMLKDFAAYFYIDKFERENRDILAALDTFDISVRDISNKLSVKKDLSKQRLQDTLVRCYNENIASSKRKGDMQRVIEGKRKWSISRFVQKYGFELFKGLKIWLMTPEAVSEVLPLENGLFDLVIFDEASQIYIEKGVPSIARARKVVIAGDHKQLRPSSLGDGRFEYEYDEEDSFDTNAALEEESLLDLARFKFPEVMLDYHYRSKYEELIAFSNYAFYKGRLNISPNNEVPPAPPISVSKVENGLWDDRKNLAEAQKTVEIIKSYLKKKNVPTIGVITFNSNQRDLIQDLIDRECVADSAFAKAYMFESSRTASGEDVGLFVKNIENVQGDERDVIIFSLAYAKNKTGKIVRNFGWLNQAGGENRLNVAISRAKRHIHIVTSIAAEELKVDDLKNEGPRIFKKYLEYAYAVSDGDKERAKGILRSFGTFNTRTYEFNDEFVGEVYRSLSACGLNAELSVGIGGYKIDIALKDDEGKYLMGIECDSNLYNRSCIARERDVHRLRYLESRGWKMYRIWSSAWWHNKNAEIRKIKSLLGLKG